MYSSLITPLLVVLAITARAVDGGTVRSKLQVPKAQTGSADRILHPVQYPSSDLDKRQANPFALDHQLDLEYADLKTYNDPKQDTFGATVHITTHDPAAQSESFGKSVSSIRCHDNKSMTITFADADMSRLAQSTWNVPEMTIVTRSSSCNEPDERVPWTVKNMQFAGNTVTMDASKMTWEDSSSNMSVEFGSRGNITNPDAEPEVFMKKRDLQKDISFGVHDQKIFSKSLGDFTITEKCKDCTVTGTAILKSGRVDVKNGGSGSQRKTRDLQSLNGRSIWSDIASHFSFATLELDLQGFTGSFLFETEANGEHSFTFHLAGEDGIGFPGLSIKDILTIGPSFDPTIVADIGIREPLTFDYGFKFTMPSGAGVSVNLLDPSQSSMNQLDQTTFSTLPFSTNAKNATSGVSFSLAFRPVLSLGIELRSKKLNPVEISMDVPKFHGTVTGHLGVDDQCKEPGDRIALGVETSFEFDAGIGTNIDFASINFKPEHKLFDKDGLFPMSTCIPIGSHKTSTTSSSRSSTSSSHSTSTRPQSTTAATTASSTSSEASSTVSSSAAASSVPTSTAATSDVSGSASSTASATDIGTRVTSGVPASTAASSSAPGTDTAATSASNTETEPASSGSTDAPLTTNKDQVNTDTSGSPATTTAAATTGDDSEATTAVVSSTPDVSADPTQTPETDSTIGSAADPTEISSGAPADPTSDPIGDPTSDPTIDPTTEPTPDPEENPGADSTEMSSAAPAANPTEAPGADPTSDPSDDPSAPSTEAADATPTGDESSSEPTDTPDSSSGDDGSVSTDAPDSSATDDPSSGSDDSELDGDAPSATDESGSTPTADPDADAGSDSSDTGAGDDDSGAEDDTDEGGSADGNSETDGTDGSDGSLDDATDDADPDVNNAESGSDSSTPDDTGTDTSDAPSDDDSSSADDATDTSAEDDTGALPADDTDTSADDEVTDDTSDESEDTSDFSDADSSDTTDDSSTDDLGDSSWSDDSGSSDDDSMMDSGSEDDSSSFF